MFGNVTAAWVPHTSERRGNMKGQKALDLSWTMEDEYVKFTQPSEILVD
jgi:hypothetical protein